MSIVEAWLELNDFKLQDESTDTKVVLNVHVKLLRGGL